MDAESKLIVLYLFVCDTMDLAFGDRRLRSRGFGPKLSDAEIMTMEIYGEIIGLRSDAAIWRHFHNHWASWFPNLGSYQTFARQAANLGQMMQILFRSVMPPPSDVHSIDGFPIPVCRFVRAKCLRSYKGEAAYGYCATKDEHYYGFKGHVVIDLEGRIAGFVITAANVDERRVLPNFFGTIRGWLIGDKGYIGKDWAELAREHGLFLTTPLRSNMKDDRDPRIVEHFMDVRRRVETTIGQLIDTFSCSAVRTRDLRHLVSRFVRKVVAYNFSLLHLEATGVAWR